MVRPVTLGDTTGNASRLSIHLHSRGELGRLVHLHIREELGTSDTEGHGHLYDQAGYGGTLWKQSMCFPAMHKPKVSYVC